MPRPYFNVSGPTSMDAIQSYIGGYATPEAAAMDTPSAPTNYLNSQYQRITGDAFADPFEDAAKNRNAAMIEAAANGASVAVGSNTGQKLLSVPILPPQGPQVMSGSGGGVALASMMPALSPSGQRTADNSILTSMLQMRGGAANNARADMQVPEPTANNYLQVLGQRANSIGAGDLFSKIQRSNPSAFSAGISADDPRFARIQGGANGKVEAADALHPIANDPHFREELRRNPTKAQALYSAVTNGRDYNTDITAKSQLLSEQSDSRKKMIEGLKGVEADPITGVYTHQKETIGLGGEVTIKKVPLTPHEVAAIDTEGGFKRIFGVEVPDKGGLPPLPGKTTAAQNQDYRTRVAALVAEKKIPAKEAANIVHGQMFTEQQQQKSGVATSQSGPGLKGNARTMMEFMGSGINTLTQKMANPLFQTIADTIYGERGRSGDVDEAFQIPPIPIRR